MNFNRNLLSEAVRYGLAAGAVGLFGLVSAPAFAQDSDEEAAKMQRIEVTGSRVKRADVEGALPVSVITREQIDASGDVSVADVMRDTTFASFGNFRPQSGSSAQGLADINLRGLGSNRTLVLIDGRRAPKAPFADSAQDLNAIPLAAVERIEILSDGASAVYGSDAIGGVVNIVLRKDFEGAEFRYGIGKTKVEGGDTEEFSVIFGAAGERGSVIAGASAQSRDMVYTRDQIGYRQGVSVYGNNYRVYDQNRGVFLTAPTAIPGFACNSDGFWRTSGGTCSFDFNSVAANEAEVANKGLFARGEYQINDDWSAYMTANATKVETFGRYAPTPALFLVADGTPNDIIQGDGFATAIYHRLAAFGNRDTTSDSTVTDLNAGIQGRIGDFMDIDFGMRRTAYRYNEFGTGYTVNPLLVAAAEAGDYDVRNPFAQPLPSVTATINRRSIWETEEIYVNTNFDLFEMGGGTSNMAVGAEYRTEDYADLYDSLSEAGLIDGSAGNSSGGDREVYAAFLEWLFPITSNFEVTFAGRFDDYSDYGSDFSPKLAARWQPLENLTLRASYGEGFRAPELSILTQKDSFSADPVIDPATCAVFGGTPAQCVSASVQVDTFYIANPNLSSEQSKQWSLGMAYDPTDWLNVTLDWYNIEIDNRIRQFSAQALINRTNDPSLGPIPPGLGVVRAPDGSIVRITAGYGNEGDLKTNGADFNLRTNFDLGDMGSLRNHLQIGYVNEYSIDGGDDLAGTLGAPDFRANLVNDWSMGDWSVGFTSRFIDGNEDSTGSVGGYTTHDLYVNWKAPWKGSLTIGANNIGDKYPSLVGYDGRPWNFNLYDAYGRTVYFRYSQSF